MLRLRFDPEGIPRILKGGRVFTVLGLFTFLLTCGVMFLLFALPSFESLGRLALVWSAVALGIVGIYLALSTLCEFELLLPIDTPSEPEQLEKERDALLALFESNSINGADAELSKLRTAQEQLRELLELIPRREVSKGKGGKKRGKKKTVFQEPLDVLRSILEENAGRAELKKTLDRLERENQKLSGQVEQAKAANAKDFAQLQTERDEAVRKSNQSAEALRLAGERIDPLEAEVRDLTAKLELAESLAQRQIAELNDTLRNAESAAQQSREEVERLTREIGESRTQAEGTLSELAERLETVRGELKDADARNEKGQEELQTLAEAKKALEAEVARLEPLLEEANQRVQDQSKTLEELQQKVDRLSQDRERFELERTAELKSIEEAHTEDDEKRRAELEATYKEEVEALRAALEEANFHRLRVFDEMRSVERVSRHVHPGTSLARHTRRISRMIREAESRLFVASILAQANRWDFVECLVRPARVPDVFEAILTELPDDLRSYCAEHAKFVESN